MAEKFLAAQAHGLTPVLCLGETLQQRERGETEQTVLEQLDIVLAAAVVEAFANSVLAYEPVWAIGTGKTASPEQAQQVHQILREHIVVKDPAVADALRILYGGKKDTNAGMLFSQPDIDGGLVGGASLEAGQFTAICASGKMTAETIVVIVHVIVAIAIVGLVLLQQGKGADAGASFGAGASRRCSVLPVV